MVIPAAADEDLGAVTRINWNPSGFTLNESSPIEQEITLSDIQGAGPGINDYHRFHLFFCWKALNLSLSMSSQRNPCGFIGLSANSNANQSSAFGFDLTLWDGVDYASMGDGSSCEKRDPMAKIAEVQTFYTVCYRQVYLSKGTKYKLRIQAVPGANSKNEYWWSAVLMNLDTNESVTVGKIKNINIEANSELTQLQNVYFYRGNPVQCDNVPVGDLLISAMKNNTGQTTKFINYTNDRCIRAKVYPDNSIVGYYQVRFGGANPTDRDPNYKEIITPTPAPTSAKPSPSAATTVVKAKPETPTFSLVNFVGNKINIDVNLGNYGDSAPDKIYLVAPKLGFNLENPLEGLISGNKATWSIDLGKLLSGDAIPLEIVAEKNGIKSNPLNGSYRVPFASGADKSLSIPIAPKNFKSRLVGNSEFVTVTVTEKKGALPTSAFLFSKSLGLNKNNAIRGEFVGSNAVFEVPVSVNMLGKKYAVTIYFANSKGESAPLNASIAFPALQNFNSIPTTVLPNKKPISTIICVRSNQSRVFEGSKCPIGWNKK